MKGAVESESAKMGHDLHEFTLLEIMEMEKIFREKGEKSLSQEICQKLASNFSCSTRRAGKSAITWEEVQHWFQEKQKELPAKVTSPVTLNEFAVPSNPSITKNAIESYSPLALVEYSPSATTTDNAIECSQRPKGERVAELSELVFEAKSAKDSAWFDVALFLNYRVVSSGELEARVRFAGFGNEEDEWVNVKRAVRERSIPLEPSECHRVKVGDLVLCFREADDHAIYCDAHIVEIQRKIHDISGCSCIFVVRYDYDNAEGRVQLKGLCCRPS